MFPERLKQLRKNRCLTQVQLAQAFNVANGTIAMWETGKREPDFDTTLRIADFFGVTVDYLINNKEKEKQEMESIYRNVLANDQTFISKISNALDLDANSLSAMISEMSNEDVKDFLTPSVFVDHQYLSGRSCTSYRLKRARFSAGLCRADLAKKLGISLNEYREYESGKKPLTHKMIIDISTGLNVNPDWLCCTIKYIDPQTNRPFDPGIYKSFIDSAYDPIDLKLNVSEIRLPSVTQDQSAIFNMLNMYLKLDPFDQGVICGEIRAFLKSEKYSLQEGSKLA